MTPEEMQAEIELLRKEVRKQKRLKKIERKKAWKLSSELDRMKESMKGGAEDGNNQ